MAVGHLVKGNIGLFHVCYELSRRGFNVVPTSRNTKAVDVIVGSADFSKHVTVQVKTTTVSMGVHIGKKSKLKTIDDALAYTKLADFWVYVRINPDNQHSVDHVFVWKGDDESLISADKNNWWFEVYKVSMRDKWEPQKDDRGWRIIEERLMQE